MPALLPTELPEVARIRHHWIVLLRPPALWPGLAGLAVFMVAVVWPDPWIVLLIVLAASVAFLRWQTWRAEVIILTRKRIIRVQGVPETTTSEAFLRIDRVSGARLVQTVPGKVLGYGTIELEAPGDHPDVRRLRRIAEPQRFYGLLRQLLFGELRPGDPDDLPPPIDGLPPAPRSGGPLPTQPPAAPPAPPVRLPPGYPPAPPRPDTTTAALPTDTVTAPLPHLPWVPDDNYPR